jgi:hypothetical protein
MTMAAANNNFIVAPRMTPTQITQAVAFILFDLVLIGLVRQYGIRPHFTGFTSLLWMALWAYMWLGIYLYAVLCVAQVYGLAAHVVNGLKQGGRSRYYVVTMISRPMPPMIISAISVGVILSLAWFSFYDAGIVGIIPSGLLLYAGVTSAMIYAHRMEYHAAIERQIGHDRQATSFNPNPAKDHVSGTSPHISRTKPHGGGMGESS